MLKKDDSSKRATVDTNLTNETVPVKTTGGTIYEHNQKLADAAWKDCLPLQYGLSKFMCDLYCLRDAVTSRHDCRTGSTSAPQVWMLPNI